jgi:hypothetical protein
MIKRRKIRVIESDTESDVVEVNTTKEGTLVINTEYQYTDDDITTVVAAELAAKSLKFCTAHKGLILQANNAQHITPENATLSIATALSVSNSVTGNELSLNIFKESIQAIIDLKQELKNHTILIPINMSADIDNKLAHWALGTLVISVINKDGSYLIDGEVNLDIYDSLFTPESYLQFLTNIMYSAVVAHASKEQNPDFTTNSYFTKRQPDGYCCGVIVADSILKFIVAGDLDCYDADGRPVYSAQEIVDLRLGQTMLVDDEIFTLRQHDNAPDHPTPERTISEHSSEMASKFNDYLNTLNEAQQQEFTELASGFVEQEERLIKDPSSASSTTPLVRLKSWFNEHIANIDTELLAHFFKINAGPLDEWADSGRDNLCIVLAMMFELVDVKKDYAQTELGTADLDDFVTIADESFADLDDIFEEFNKAKSKAAGSPKRKFRM